MSSGSNGASSSKKMIVVMPKTARRTTTKAKGSGGCGSDDAESTKKREGRIAFHAERCVWELEQAANHIRVHRDDRHAIGSLLYSIEHSEIASEATRLRRMVNERLLRNGHARTRHHATAILTRLSKWRADRFARSIPAIVLPPLPDPAEDEPYVPEEEDISEMMMRMEAEPPLPPKSAEEDTNAAPPPPAGMTLVDLSKEEED